MSTIVITEYMHRPSVDTLMAQHQVHFDPKLVDKPKELFARISGCKALIVGNRTRVDSTLLDHAGPQLKVVGRLGVGLERIDLKACEIQKCCFRFLTS